MKVSKGTCIIVICILQIFVLLFGIIHINIILFRGEEAVIKMEGYDPYDPLRGRYLTLRIADEKVALERNSISRYKNYDNNLVYVVLTKSATSNTYDTFDYATLDKPINGEIYIKCPSSYLSNENEVWIYPNLNTYYLNEKLAIELDAITRDPETEMYLVLKILNGNYTIDSIIINGQLY